MSANSTTPPFTRKQSLSFVGISLVIVYIIWNVDLFSWAAYPIRLFVTYIHEAGHSVAAIITGGEVTGFTLSPDGSGVAWANGGWRVIILPAGYIGAALFGAALFYFINTHPQWSRRFSIGLGAGILLFTFLYARPDDNFIPLALFVGVLYSTLFMSLGVRGDTRINFLVLSVMSIMTGLNAVLDITRLTSNASACMVAGGQQICNDAAAFSAEFSPGVPAEVWAYMWSGLSIWLIVMSVYYSLIRPAIVGPKNKAIKPDTPKKPTQEEAFGGIKLDKDGNIDWSQFK